MDVYVEKAGGGHVKDLPDILRADVQEKCFTSLLSRVPVTDFVSESESEEQNLDIDQEVVHENKQAARSE